MKFNPICTIICHDTLLFLKIIKSGNNFIFLWDISFYQSYQSWKINWNFLDEIKKNVKFKNFFDVICTVLSLRNYKIGCIISYVKLYFGWFIVK